MAITLLGTLPISATNLGLAATPPGFTAQVAKLTADLAKLADALAAQVTVQTALPPDPTFLLALQNQLDPTTLALVFAQWPTLNADANTDLVAELAFIDAQLLILEGITVPLQVGVDAGSLAGWTYSGQARGFGTELEAATVNGFGGVDRNANVDAIIVAAADFSAWGSFSGGFNTGTSDDENLGSVTTQTKLQSLGVLSGGQWNTGVVDALRPLFEIQAVLEGLSATLTAQIELTLGIGLPDPGDIVDFGLTIDLGAALDNLVNVQTDLGATFDAISLKITALEVLLGELNAVLAVGGLSVWSYSGRAGGLGADFAPQVQDGLPGVGSALAPAYGVVVASQSPTAWADFGQIFIT